MIRIQFNNQKSFKDVSFTLLSDTSVFISGEKIKPNKTGFKAYRLNGDLLGDYSDYTKCTETEDGLILEKEKDNE